MTDDPLTKSHGPVRRAMRDDVIVPLAMSAVAAATAYAAKKAPQLLEEKVLPRIRERGGVRSAMDDVLERAPRFLRRGVSAAVERARDLGGTVESTGGAALRRARSATHSLPGAPISGPKRDQARRERADRRRQRRKALAR